MGTYVRTCAACCHDGSATELLERHYEIITDSLILPLLSRFEPSDKDSRLPCLVVTGNGTFFTELCPIFQPSTSFFPQGGGASRCKIELIM
jgi:hypothetical protein